MSNDLFKQAQDFLNTEQGQDLASQFKGEDGQIDTDKILGKAQELLGTDAGKQAFETFSKEFTGGQGTGAGADANASSNDFMKQAQELANSEQGKNIFEEAKRFL